MLEAKAPYLSDGAFTFCGNCDTFLAFCVKIAHYMAFVTLHRICLHIEYIQQNKI